MENIDNKTQRKIACALSGLFAVMNEQDDLSEYVYENPMYIYPMSKVDLIIYPSTEPNGTLACRICLMEKDMTCWIVGMSNIKEYLSLIIQGDYDKAEEMLLFADDYPLFFLRGR